MSSENKARKKEDLRMTRTKKMACDALTRLLATKAIEKISIKDIATEAMINRNTFYLHFENMGRFLEYYYKNCLDDLSVRFFDFEKEATSLTFDYFSDCVEQLVKNMDDYSFIYQSLLVKSTYTPFLKSVESIVMSHIQVMLRTRNKGADENIIKVTAYYLTSGLIGVLAFWMDNKNDILSQDIIQVLCKLNSRNFTTVLNTPDALFAST